MQMSLVVKAGLSNGGGSLTAQASYKAWCSAGKPLPQASLEDFCQSASVCGVQISPQGLQERLNSRQANQFLHQLLLQGITYLVQALK
jgi:hypothetical protein